MITARLKNAAGNVLCEIRLPEHLHEMTLQQYVSFDSVASGEGNPIAIMAEAVQDFTGVDMRTIIEAQVGDVYKRADALDESLRSVFGYISRLITAYEPKMYNQDLHEFQYKGDTYRIPYIRTMPLGLGEVLPDISVVEAIEALELLRISENNKKERPGEEANIRFTTYLKMLSILARKEGEELPVNDAHREQFLTERLIHFQEIDAATALDVDFFLLSSLQRLNVTHEIAGFFIRRVSALAVETCGWKGRPTTVRRRTINKSLPASEFIG